MLVFGNSVNTAHIWHCKNTCCSGFYNSPPLFQFCAKKKIIVSHFDDQRENKSFI